jgi:hypothetical protein
MADGSTFTARPASTALRGYRCDECKTVTHLSDLNDEMLCPTCAGPWEDPESIIDTSPAAMLRAHGTWRL